MSIAEDAGAGLSAPGAHGHGHGRHYGPVSGGATQHVVDRAAMLTVMGR